MTEETVFKFIGVTFGLTLVTFLLLGLYETTVCSYATMWRDQTSICYDPKKVKEENCNLNPQLSYCSAILDSKATK